MQIAVVSFKSPEIGTAPHAQSEEVQVVTSSQFLPETAPGWERGRALHNGAVWRD